jgi:hypothetical protein
MKRLVILILLMGALIIPLTAYAQPQTAPSVVATGSDNVPKPMAYVAFKGSDGQVQKQIFELDQDNVVTVNQNGRLSFSAVEGISISMVKITDVNKVTYGVPVQDNSVVLSVPRGVYSLNAISGPYAYTGIVVVTGPQSQAAGESQGQGGGGGQDDPEITRIIDRVIIDTITFIDIWITTLFQPIAIIPLGLPADIALNGIGEACYGYAVDLTDTLNCNNFLDPSVFDPALRDVGELTEDTKDTENDDNVDNDATTQQDSPIDDIPMSNACQQGCINLVDPSGHDNTPDTGDNDASTHQSGDENNNDNEGDEGGSNEGGEGDNEESGSSEED